MGNFSVSTSSLSALLLVVEVFLFFFFHKVSAMACIEEEREALLKLKASFVDPSNRLTSWKGIDCCSWYGVGCNETNGHVVKLDLRNKRNYGWGIEVSSNSLHANWIDSSLLKLKYLNHLDLSGNYFNYSQIPYFLASMQELQYLNLSYAYFYGRIPPHLGNLTNLLVLDLNSVHALFDYRKISGKMLYSDDFEWISHLSSLQSLDLSGVNIEKALNLMKVLNSLPSLLSLKLQGCNLRSIHLFHSPFNSSFLLRIQHLDLSHNMFDCPIPDAFQNMTSLKFLYLSNSSFNSVIPLWSSNLKNLIVVNLGSNLFSRFEGGLSSMMTNNCHLKEFYLSYNPDLRGDVFGSRGNSFTGCNEYDLEVLQMENNKITASIPKWFGQLKNLKILDLSGNSLYGPIPTSLGNLSSIEFLDVSYNLLSGGIATSFGKLVTLRFLNLRANKLDGVILESFGQLQSLGGVDLSRNYFRGVLSEIHFANLSQLNVLWITGNGLLSFDVKHDWVPPFQLTTFAASSIKGFGIEFPLWLETQKEISYLALANANISGPIPTWLRGHNFQVIDLSNNQITGSFPQSISNQMPNLVALSISNARINGSLPRSICKLKNLSYLALSGNSLTGTVPSCILNPNFTLLDLSSNKFSQIFQILLQNISRLRVMSLANNRIEGELPVVLRTCRSLSILDVEGNRFSGNIPTWLAESLQNLQILNLRANMFSGTIPASLWLLPYIQILVLADNKLRGNIPSNLRNLSAMSQRPIADYSYICEEGAYSTPCYVNYVSQVIKSRDVNYTYLQLYSMVNVDLSNNSLVGHIPRKILTIKALFGLNLSHNNLSGKIPVDIGKEKSLESLDLSFNQLSGPIPDSFSGLNSLGVLKLSNNNISGRIPREGHLSTFNDASSFYGNPYLCGEPLPMKCPNEESFEPPTAISNFDNHNGQQWDKWEKMWFYICVMAGYATGFWVVIGILIFKRQWRYAYFQFIEETKDKIHVAILLYMEKLKRRKRGNNDIT